MRIITNKNSKRSFLHYTEMSKTKAKYNEFKIQETLKICYSIILQEFRPETITDDDNDFNTKNIII